MPARTPYSRAAGALTALALLVFAVPAWPGPSITVYPHDLGFVRETRTVELRAARDTLRLTDVPKRIDFSSVRLDAGGAKVERLAYRFDVATGDRLIESSIGQRVRVVSRGDRLAEGRLLSADGSWLVLRAADGSVSTLSRAAVQELRLANPPAGLSLKPTLEAVIAGARRGRTEMGLSYLTGGLSWSAEHVVVIRGERRAQWSAGVTVDNTTGIDFVNADLKLVAGQPNRQQAKAMPLQRAVAMDLATAADGGPELRERSFAEYHLYTLDHPATLRDRESQRLSMIAPREVTVTPRYYYVGGDPRGVSRQIEVMNTRQAGLGVPLPAGRVRFYQADPDGALQFVGETQIRHTPEGEKLTLEIGRAFDLAAERREVSSRRITDRERETTVEIKLRNRKRTPVTIVTAERVAGDTEITQKNHDFVRKDANTIEFTVAVPAGQEEVIRYTARVRY